MILMVTDKSHAEIMKEYKSLSWAERSIVRELAVQSLLDTGSTEVGTSDVNCSIVSLYNSYGSFANIVKEGW